MSEHWQTVPLGSVVRFYSGTGFPERFQGFTNGDIPFFKVSDMSREGNEVCLQAANNYVSGDLVRREGWRLVPAGSIAFAKVGAALLLNRRRKLTCDCLVDNNMMAVEPQAGVSTDWIYWQLQRVDFGCIVQDGALPSINQGQVAAIGIPQADTAEQLQVSSLLNDLDTTIRQTEAIIEKLKQVKQGLLYDLLTRGIDANGELRATQSQAPHLYKDSPLGWIPLSWSCTRLAELADVTVAYVGPTNPFYTSQEHGVLFLRTGNITERGIELDDVRWVTKAFHRIQQKSALHDGDVVVSRVGYTGTAAVVGALGDTNAANMIIIRPQPKLSAQWVRRLFGMDIFGRQVSGFTAGSAQPVLNIQLVERLLTPTPPLQEQTRILEVLEAVDQRIDAERAARDKLQLQKSGVMDDLLTGRVRVTPLLDAATRP
jgi:type I restriction enzyme, S subunit